MSEKDMLVVLAASYDSVEDAEADYEAVKKLYDAAGIGHSFDAAVLERRRQGQGGRQPEAPARLLPSGDAYFLLQEPIASSSSRTPTVVARSGPLASGRVRPRRRRGHRDVATCERDGDRPTLAPSLAHRG